MSVRGLACSLPQDPCDAPRACAERGAISRSAAAICLAAWSSSCTGSQQVGVADGWFVLLRLSAGDHTLVVTATAPSGHATSQTFLLHVQGEGDDDD